MELLLLDQKEEPEIPDLKFPRYEPFEIAVHECRIYDSRGQLIAVTQAKRIGQVLAEPYIEPTRQEYFKKNWKLAGSC